MTDEDIKILQEHILEHMKSRTSDETLKIQLLALKYRLEDAIEEIDTRIKNPKCVSHHTYEDI